MVDIPAEISLRRDLRESVSLESEGEFTNPPVWSSNCAWKERDSSLSPIDADKIFLEADVEVDADCAYARCLRKYYWYARFSRAARDVGLAKSFQVFDGRLLAGLNVITPETV